MTDSENKSYKTVLKTTGLVGIVQIIGIAMGVIRSKAIALILGTAGFGVLSLYNSFMEFMNSSCQFGIGAGGVRQLALEKSNNELNEVHKIVFILKSWIISVSTLALLLIVIFSKQISLLQFQSEKYHWGIIIISFGVLFTNIYNINLIVLNGIREIKTMAKVQVFAALWSVIFALPILYFLKSKGIEVSILVVAFANLAVSTYYMRKSDIKMVRPHIAVLKHHLRAIFAVGLSYAIPGVIGSCLLYCARYYLKDTFDYNTLGIYQACITLSTLYVQTILSAMGVDFLPRLMAVKDNNHQINIKVTEQMELGVLLASIGVMATFIFAPYILQLFYSHEFVSGVPILRWQILAVFIRVLEWPLGYATTAKGKNVLYIFLQIAYHLFEFALLVAFTQWIGFQGLGVSYFVAYIIFFVVRYLTVRHITGFHFSGLLKSMLIRIVSFFVIILCLFQGLNQLWATLISTIVLILYLYYCQRVLIRKMQIDPISIIKSKIRRFISNS
ncbi:MAG: oligosaccharide flippase family protein [Bacteroidota bacterium]|nr:oligosaccharide flippase family protein [Bacteroidota bacterium]